MMIALFWLPYARAAGPTDLAVAPAGPARAGLMQLIRDTKVPAGEIYLSSYDGIDADVTGTGHHARVVISRGLWAKASPAMLRASIGHLIGHYRHGDQLSLAVLLAGLTFTTFLGVQLLAPPVARRLGLEGPGDSAALPLLAALFLLFFTADEVVEHAFVRAINVRADQFSLDNAKEPDGLAQALLLEWHGERVDPSPLEEALFYDHPSLKSRLIHAMRWKAEHPR
jgi:STE24 endopeptidase